MGFMDKLKETAGKAAEKAGAMKDSAMDTYGKRLMSRRKLRSRLIQQLWNRK